MCSFQDNFQQCYKRGGTSGGPRTNSRGKDHYLSYPKHTSRSFFIFCEVLPEVHCFHCLSFKVFLLCKCSTEDLREMLDYRNGCGNQLSI